MWRNEGKWSPSAGVDDILDRMLIARIGCAELLRHSKNLLEHERMKDRSARPNYDFRKLNILGPSLHRLTNGIACPVSAVAQ